MIKTKKNIQALSYKMIYKLFSKNKHIIFFLDVENQFIKNDDLATIFFDRTKCQLYESIFLEAHNLYYLEFNSYQHAKEFFHKHYFPNKYKDFKIVIEFYSNSQLIEDNL